MRRLITVVVAAFMLAIVVILAATGFVGGAVTPTPAPPSVVLTATSPLPTATPEAKPTHTGTPVPVATHTASTVPDATPALSPTPTGVPAPTSTPTPIVTRIPNRGPLAAWQRGLTLHPVHDGYYGTQLFKEAIDGLARTGANSVALTVPLVQTDLWSTDVQTYSVTPTDAELVAAIDYVHGKGLAVMIIPHLRSVKGDWAAYVDPVDRTAWFRSYGDRLKHIADIAQKRNVELLCVGSEMGLMTSDRHNPTNTQNWTGLIKEVRAIYSGKLTFSAHWGPAPGEKEDIGFWPLLDYIGIAAYFYFPETATTVDDLMATWDIWARWNITPLNEKYKKPVLFTEVGYRNVTGARMAPWDPALQGDRNEEEQANLYEALLAYWSRINYFQGVYFWEWLPVIAPGNTYFTPSDKLAQDVLTRWYSGEQPTPQPTATPVAP